MPTQPKQAAHQANARKIKKSYTLSPESVAFLETLRKRRRAPSISSVLEGVLKAVRRQQVRAEIETSIESYYSTLSDQEAAEQADWGDFATSEFLREQ
jgi:hypothetical protein